MTELSTKLPIKIRTYASDLDRVRKQRKELEKSKQVKPATEQTKSTPLNPPDSIHISPKVEKPAKPLAVVKKLPEVNIVVPKQILEKEIVTTTQIPSFHELQKQITAIQQNKTQNSTELITEKISLGNKKSEEEPEVRLNIGYDATVITDTKSDGFNFFASVIKSLNDWFKTISSEHKKRKAHVYSVPETQRRKGVIQKATSRSATTFTSGSDSMRDQIRKRNLEEATSKSHTPETSWSPFIDSGYTLLEAPDMTQNVTVEYKQVPTFVPVKKEVAEIIEESEILPLEEIATQDNTEELEEAEDDTLSEERWAASDAPTSNIPESTEIDVTSDIIYNEPIPLTKKDVREVESSSFFKQFESNTAIVVLLIAVASLAAIIIASRLVLEQIKIKQATEITIPKYSAKQIVTDTTTVPVVLTTKNINDLPTLLYSTIETAPAGVIELAVLAPDGTEVTGSYIFDLLHFRAIPNLRQSLTAVRFISINHGTPAILLQFSDNDSMRGGLLKWETTLSNDMAPIYKTPYVSETLFTDSVVDGIPVRSLSPTGNPILLYGFINENTVIISGNTEGFAQITKQVLLH